MIHECGAVLPNGTLICSECRFAAYEKLMPEDDIYEAIEDVDEEAYELFLSEG